MKKQFLPVITWNKKTLIEKSCTNNVHTGEKFFAIATCFGRRFFSDRAKEFVEYLGLYEFPLYILEKRRTNKCCLRKVNLSFCMCYITDSIVHVLSHFLQSALHCPCFISFSSVCTSFPSVHIHLIHFVYHSPSHSPLPYLVAFILHLHSILLSISIFSQSRL